MVLPVRNSPPAPRSAGRRPAIRGALRALAVACLLAAAAIAPHPARAAGPGVCFTPPRPGGCDPTATIVQAIAAARRTIRLQIYAFTSRPILAALLAAHRRGVDLRAIVDRSQLDDDPRDAAAVARLAAGGATVLVDTVPGLMHDKIMIIDAAEVLTGSFNYTWSAEHRNAENLLVLRDPALAARYARNWAVAAARALPYAALAETRRPPRARLAAGAVRGNRRSHIYQWPGCPYYDRIAAGNRVAFASAQAAREAGYRPAHNCR
ncbi:MAG: DUF1669 domain-containing protein [Rhodospirillales bacterium]|nr:DUF1669 domain-containing protein [Rhodospirillales bacterium]